MKSLYIVFLAAMVWVLPLCAQEDPEVATDLLAEDITAIEAISLYPESVRRTIMEAAGYPDALLRIEEIQKKSQERFEYIIAPFAQEVQEDFYEVARYPKLITELTLGGKKSKGEIKTFLQDYPEEVHEQAFTLGRKRYQELREIQALQEATDRAFQKMLAEYPADVRMKLEELVAMPEVLDIMLESFRSTVMLGAMYQRNPEWLWHVTDSIQLELANQKAEELNNWKAQLEEDPEAMEEFQEAAEDFVKENGYEARPHRAYPDHYSPYWLSQAYTPYSFWYGYPYWYPHRLWYPHAYYYHWGFYYGPQGQLVIFDFPSWYFMDWYFVWAHHHYQYPHLTHTYLRYHERHRNSTTAATRVIGEWSAANRNLYTRDWLKDDANRVRRIREYGARETQRQRTIIDAPRSPNYNRSNRPNYTSPSRIPQTPSRVMRDTPPQRTVKPAPTKPAPNVRPTPTRPRPQVDQARRYHSEKMVKKRQ
jgi:hypothetical protein